MKGLANIKPLSWDHRLKWLQYCQWSFKVRLLSLIIHILLALWNCVLFTWKPFLKLLVYILAILVGSVWPSHWSTEVVLTYKVPFCGLLIMTDCSGPFLFTTEGNHSLPLCLMPFPFSRECALSKTLMFEQQKCKTVMATSMSLAYGFVCLNCTRLIQFGYDPTLKPFCGTARVTNLMASSSSWTLGKDIPFLSVL